jgi:ech hydrogenase subunit D
MTARREGDEVILLYHLGKGAKLSHLGLRQADAGPFPSASGIFAGAWLYENEIQDQFGIRFAGLAPDFGGRLFLRPDSLFLPWGGEKPVG